MLLCSVAENPISADRALATLVRSLTAPYQRLFTHTHTTARDGEEN
jgi:hypothetical protein